MSGTPLSVVLAGGGSAGHVSPLLATADALRRHDPDTVITVLGTAEGLESRLVPLRGYRLETIAKVPMPRTVSTALLAVPGKLSGAVSRVATILRQSRADVVVGMGGYVSPPAYLAAKRLGIPIVVHEQNSKPGLANRLGARLTSHVATTFDGSGLPHARRIGMPLRTEITDLAKLDPAAREQAAADARRQLDLDATLPVLLVTGGSLGAQKINEAMADVIDDLTGNVGSAGAHPVQVLHLTGEGKAEPVLAAVTANTNDNARSLYHVREYLDQMQLAYAAADLVLCRAGANTVAELTCLGLPAVYVPLAVGNGEQRLNAEGVVAAGGGLLVDNSSLDGESLRTRVLPLVRDSARLGVMSAAASHFGSRDADDVLAQLIRDAAGKP